MPWWRISEIVCAALLVSVDIDHALPPSCHLAKSDNLQVLLRLYKPTMPETFFTDAAIHAGFTSVKSELTQVDSMMDALDDLSIVVG
jgi:hypothetical protein